MNRHRRLHILALALLLSALPVAAHSPIVDSRLTDWCLGAFSNTAPGGGRTEDSYAMLMCGNCSTDPAFSCVVNGDCPSGTGTCVNPNSRQELVWWDNRTDGAVNDLGTIAITQDNTNLYFAAELWVDPDPVSLPFGEIALDVRPGGKNTWHDPNNVLTTPGTCSASPGRACTSDADCHFCAISTEPFPSNRKRTCGSGCNPDIPADVCNMNETCQGLGLPGAVQGVGQSSSPSTLPDYLVVFDFSRWLIGLTDAVQLMEDVNGTWTPQAVFFPAVNPGASGGSGGPPGSVEVAIPWSAFGCTGCPAACSCPGFGPGDDYRFTMVVARGSLTVDYSPDGAIEDVMSEAVAGTSTTSTDSCPGMGIGTTVCELLDTSLDAFVPPGPAVAGAGETDGLRIAKGAAGNLDLSWNASCLASDGDYEVYEGIIGNWYSHVPVAGFCSTGGATTASVSPAAGGRYYLIVPSGGAVEGSYGRDSGTTQRPSSTSACTTQSIGVCP